MCSIAGCTRLVWGGHTSVPTDPPIVGWNSEEGYRRNTFDLRARRSVFDYEGDSTIMEIDLQLFRLKLNRKFSVYIYICQKPIIDIWPPFIYTDPFEKPKQLQTMRQRTQSAPATIRLMRQKSASAYRSFPGRGRRAISAMPRPTSGHVSRPLATGPIT